MNDRAIGSWRRGDAHPIAHGRKIGGGTGVVPESAADLRPAFEIARDAPQPALLLHDARDLQRAIVSDLFLKERVPPERVQ